MNVAENLNRMQFNLNSALILAALILGLSVFIMPVHILLIMTVGVLAMVFFVAKPQYAYYLLIFTIPLTERLRFLPVSFSYNDIFVLICTFAVGMNMFLLGENFSLRTKLDKWIILLTSLYFLAGITSVNDSGILSSFKFIEAIFVYYMTVYLVRTNKVNISSIIKVLIFTATCQAVLAVVQSITGELGANFQSSRGYLGRLGIGSTTVWHGLGTMDHFNSLGNFLVSLALFFTPIYYFLTKGKIHTKLTGLLIFWGIILTYSRGSLLGLFFGGVYFLSQIIKNKLKFTLIVTGFCASLASAYLFLRGTSYIQTLSPRNSIWDGIIASVMSSDRFLWLGAGLNSYFDVVVQYLPQKIPFEFAHSYYLLTVQEMGLIGAAIQFSFFIFILIQCFKGFNSNNGILKALNLSIGLVVFSIFFLGIFDHSYSLTFFKILLFLLLGTLYAKTSR